MIVHATSNFREGMGNTIRISVSYIKARSEGGGFTSVQTNINSKTYLRTSLMNPFTRTAHLEGLLDEIEKIAADL
jgi:hypothetical protein